MPLYVADTNLFIEAHRSSYPLDIFSSFWNLLKQLADDEQIVSIDKVRDEIYENEDELTEWIDANLPDGFFKETNSEEVLDAYGKIVTWAKSRDEHYLQAAVDEFMEFTNADAWLVAWCKATDNKVVTQEVSNPVQRNRIPIPQVCKAHDVDYCNMIEMFRELGVRF